MTRLVWLEERHDREKTTFLRFFPETYSFCEIFSANVPFPLVANIATLRCKVNRSENSVSDLLSLKKPGDRGKLKVEEGLSVVVRVRVSPGARRRVQRRRCGPISAWKVRTRTRKNGFAVLDCSPPLARVSFDVRSRVNYAEQTAKRLLDDFSWYRQLAENGASRLRSFL